MKWKDFICDTKWYLWDKPKDIYKTIRHWWHCNGKNPYHWKLIWYINFHHYPWDSDFLWEIVRLHILKSHYYFERHQYISVGHLNDILKWQKIAISLLDIITDKRDLWDFKGTGYDGHYICLVKVNMKNKDRFAVQYTDWSTGLTGFTTRIFEVEPHTLYREKAKRLLLRILDTYAADWWD